MQKQLIIVGLETSPSEKNLFFEYLSCILSKTYGLSFYDDFPMNISTNNCSGCIVSGDAVSKIPDHFPVPVIGVICKSSLAKGLYPDTKIKHIILWNDDLSISPFISSHIFTIDLPVFPPTKSYTAVKKEEEIDIVVAFDRVQADHLIVQVIPCLSKMKDKKITIITRNPYFSSCNSDHIIINDTDQGIYDIIRDSKMFIGNGRMAAIALLNHKPVIIVGELGLGTPISSETIDLHIQSKFSGRLGGSFGEVIPPRLLFTQINNIFVDLDKGIEIKLDTDHLYSYLEGVNKELFQFIDSIIQSPMDTLWLNPFVDWRQIPSEEDESKYILFDRRTQYHYGMIGEDEEKVIDAFRSGALPIDVCNNYEIEPEIFNEFIADLTTQRILM